VPVGQAPVKYCLDCREHKPLEVFTNDRRRADGKAFYCRDCARRRRRRDRHRQLGREPMSRHPNDVEVPPCYKWCPDCETVSPLEQFPRNRSTPTGYAVYCKPCHNARGKASKDKVGGARTYHLQRRYGVTAQEVEVLVAAQGGRCAICREAPAEHVDHDHETGRVRGVLCFNCNGGLGQFRDRLDVMASAIAYLQGVTWAELLGREGVFLGISSHPVSPLSPSS